MSKREHEDHSYFTKSKKISVSSDKNETSERDAITYNANDWAPL